MRYILSPAIGFPKGAPASVDHATLHLELAGNIGAYGASAPNHWPNEIWAISSPGDQHRPQGGAGDVAGRAAPHCKVFSKVSRLCL